MIDINKNSLEVAKIYNNFEEKHVKELHELTGASVQECTDAIKYSVDNKGGIELARAYLISVIFGGGAGVTFDDQVKDWEKTLIEARQNINKAS